MALGRMGWCRAGVLIYPESNACGAVVLRGVMYRSLFLHAGVKITDR
jgi:hypothetical protein